MRTGPDILNPPTFDMLIGKSSNNMLFGRTTVLAAMPIGRTMTLPARQIFSCLSRYRLSPVVAAGQHSTAGTGTETI